MATTVLAIDLGASSGRAIKATLEDDTLCYEEIHRFPNVPVEKNNTLYWDFQTILAQVYTAIDKAGQFNSIGFDTWGIDFGLLDEDGNLLQDPVHYRDKRTLGMAHKACRLLPASELYRGTGTQIMDMNTLFQLLAVQKYTPQIWAQASRLLFMPDLLSYMLCTNAVCEQTVASTSQMLHPQLQKWNNTVLETFHIPREKFAPLVPSGTCIGNLSSGAKVIAVAGHDTQCAVASMPGGQDAAFVSCGTWSLFGCELEEPILTDRSRRLGFSNELGANGKVNYLKNLTGLWLVQESRRAFAAKGQMHSYAELERLALEAKPLQCFINTDDPVFTPPGDIPARVRAYCLKTGQYVPQTVGEIMRCIYESIALQYRCTLDRLSAITGKQFTNLHVLGGGAKDGLLCQMAANSCKIEVKAGPVEATALGNIMVQLIALGKLKNIEAGRRLIEKTERIIRYTPVISTDWEAALQIFKTLL